MRKSRYRYLHILFDISLLHGNRVNVTNGFGIKKKHKWSTQERNDKHISEKMRFKIQG